MRRATRAELVGEVTGAKAGCSLLRPHALPLGSRPEPGAELGREPRLEEPGSLRYPRSCWLKSNESPARVSTSELAAGVLVQRAGISLDAGDRCYIINLASRRTASPICSDAIAPRTSSRSTDELFRFKATLFSPCIQPFRLGPHGRRTLHGLPDRRTRRTRHRWRRSSRSASPRNGCPLEAARGGAGYSRLKPQQQQEPES